MANTNLLPGTLDMLVLKAVSLGPEHGYGLLLRIQRASRDALVVEQGALYPALFRLESQGFIRAEWGVSENKRKAKFYTLTSTGEARLRHQLLSLAGNRLIYCADAGAIVALDPESGRRVWARRYTSRGHQLRSPRDLAPCLCARGRIYAAPADYERILCLDAGNGALVWERMRS